MHRFILVIASLLALAACESKQLSTADAVLDQNAGTAPEYRIGPGDTLQIFVWQNPDLSVQVPVRPDGRISLPLVQDLEAAQKTPSELSKDITERLETYVRSPVVTVIVTSFVGPYSAQVRVVGEAAKPQAIPFRANMSVLDVMIAVEGLTQFAAGNRAVIMRRQGGQVQEIPVHLDDLMKDGDLSANVAMLPGDVLIIPQSWF
jgi:polysaccharide export outer membrane protein